MKPPIIRTISSFFFLPCCICVSFLCRLLFSFPWLCVWHLPYLPFFFCFIVPPPSSSACRRSQKKKRPEPLQESSFLLIFLRKLKPLHEKHVLGLVLKFPLLPLRKKKATAKEWSLPWIRRFRSGLCIRALMVRAKMGL